MNVHHDLAARIGGHFAHGGGQLLGCWRRAAGGLGCQVSESQHFIRIGPVYPSAADLPYLHPSSAAPSAKRRFPDTQRFRECTGPPEIRLDARRFGYDALATQHAAKRPHRCLRESFSLCGFVALVVELFGNFR